MQKRQKGTGAPAPSPAPPPARDAPPAARGFNVTALLLAAAASFVLGCVLTALWIGSRTPGPAPAPTQAVQIQTAEPLAAADPETHHRSKATSTDYRNVWRYSHGRKCDERKLALRLSTQELEYQQLSPASLEQLVEAFRTCGVIVLNNAISVSDVNAFATLVDDLFQPFHGSRCAASC